MQDQMTSFFCTTNLKFYFGRLICSCLWPPMIGEHDCLLGRWHTFVKTTTDVFQHGSEVHLAAKLIAASVCLMRCFKSLSPNSQLYSCISCVVLYCIIVQYYYYCKLCHGTVWTERLWPLLYSNLEVRNKKSEWLQYVKRYEIE